MEASFAEVAKYTGIIGLVLFVLFVLVKGLLALNVFSTLPEGHTYEILNKLLNVVLIICLAAIVFGSIEKCKTLFVDKSLYNIEFEEIQIFYAGNELPAEMRDYNICFSVRSGNEKDHEEIDLVLRNFVKPSPNKTISLRESELKNVKSSDGCEIHIGFDPIKSNACAKNTDIIFEGKISKMDFEHFKNSGNCPPITLEKNNFILTITYKLIKQNQ